jgi:hypothetical protein
MHGKTFCLHVMMDEFDTSTKMKMKMKMNMNMKKARPGKVPRETEGVGRPSRPPGNPDADSRVRSCPFPSGKRTDFSGQQSALSGQPWAVGDGAPGQRPSMRNPSESGGIELFGKPMAR